MTRAFVEYARFEFELSKRQKDGATLREHLMLVWERSGQMPKHLAERPDLPDVLEPLWADFLDLHVSRGVGMGGPLPISFTDIDAWQRVTGNRLEGWQLAMIRRADAAYLATRSEDG